MEQTVIDRVLKSLRQRHQALVDWWSGATDAEKSLRLGPYPPAAIEGEMASLNSAISKAERLELGQCVVCHEQVNDHLLEMDYSACVCLEHLTGEERSRLESELELSQKVQRALLPQSPPEIPGWEVSAFSQPASIVGGDYFDFLRFADGTHGILIADVMGKGMPASMLMANLQASIRILVPESATPHDVLVRLNRLFHHNITLTKFVTVFLGKLDPESGDLHFVNAGHHPPILVRTATAALEELRPTGPAIGITADPSYGEKAARLEKGDLLVLYTDGLVEARNEARHEFGDDRLRMIISTPTSSAATLVRDVRKQLQTFVASAPMHDDTTLIVYKR